MRITQGLILVKTKGSKRRRKARDAGNTGEQRYQ